MKIVKIADAKNNLSRYLEYVEKGGRVRIIKRDRPVADLVPIEPASPRRGRKQDDDDWDRLLDSLALRGLVRRGKKGPVPPELLRPSPVKDPQGLVLKALLEERRTGR